MAAAAVSSHSPVLNFPANFIDPTDNVIDIVKNMHTLCVAAGAERMSNQQLTEFSASWIQRIAGEKNADGYTVLMHAAHTGHDIVLRVLLQCGFQQLNINAKYPANKLTALHFAASRGHIKAMIMLARFACDIDPKDRNGNTPLFYLHGRGVKVIEQWLKFKPNLDARNHQGRALVHKLAENGDVESMRLIADRGANMKMAIPTDYFNNGFMVHLRPLHFAAAAGHSGVLDFLRSGRDTDKDTVWQRPTTWRDFCDSRFCDFALQITIIKGKRKPFLSLLRENHTNWGDVHVSDVWKAGIYGMNALHLAVIYGRLRMIKDMREMHCDVKYALKRKDNTDRTPRDYAKKPGNEEILQFFNEHYPEEEPSP